MSKAASTAEVRAALQTALAAAMAGELRHLGSIVAALDHADDEVRLSAARLCERIGPSAAIAPLSRMAVSDRVSDNRNQAICALLGIGRPAGVPALIDALGDPEGARRDDARWALVRLLGKDLAHLLADEIDPPDPQERVRVTAWWREHAAGFDPTLCHAFGAPASPLLFIDELRASRSAAPDAALAMLTEWTGEDFGHGPRARVLAKWQRWWQSHAAAYPPGRRMFRGVPVP
jgi:hypothetical protein